MSLSAAAQRERRALLRSIAASVVLGVLALVWGVLTESRVVLFDGVVVLLGIALSGLSLLAAAAAAASPTQRYPFGKQAAAPLVIAVQGAALLGTLAYAAVDAIALIRGGGSDAAPSSVLGYGVVSAVLSVLVAAALSRVHGSDLVRAEAAQWRAGAGLSSVIGIGGAVALLLERSRWDAAVAYADPILVLVACALLAPVPVRLLRGAVRELMEAAPPAHVQAAIDAAIAEARAQHRLPQPHVASTKLGNRLYVDLRFLVEDDRSVAEEDDVRRAVIARLERSGLEIWANVELTRDVGLVE